MEDLDLLQDASEDLHFEFEIHLPPPPSEMIKLEMSPSPPKVEMVKLGKCTDNEEDILNHRSEVPSSYLWWNLSHVQCCFVTRVEK